jgi:hypothetical protein
MSESKRRSLNYKTAVFLKELGDANVNLESLLKMACKKVKKAKERMYAPQSDEQRHFINYHAGHSNSEKLGHIFGCEFLGFEEGASQSTLSTAVDAEELDLDSLPAEKGKEFLEGSVYFGVSANHVIIMPSRSLRSKHLETYLNWLLIEKAKVLPKDCLMRLDDHMPEAKKQKLAKDVLGLRVSAPVRWADGPDEETKVNLGKSVGTTTVSRVKPTGAAWDAVKTFLGDAFSIPKGLTLMNLADTPNIEVSLSLRWLGQKDEDEVSFLDGIASNLRHVDGEIDFKIDTKTGSIERDEFKHFTHISNEWKKGRPVFDTLFPKMADWLALLIRNGIIDP